MKLDYYEYTIAECFEPALINGDITGLSDDEVDQFHAWIESTDREITHWDAIDAGEHFCRCEVSSLYSNCILVRGYFYVTE